MKISKRIVLFIILVFLLINIGCSGVPVRIDSFPKQPVDTTKGKGRTITAKSCGFQLFLLIPIMVNGRQAKAYQELLMKAERDYITNIKIKESWVYGFVGTAYCTELEATAYPYLTEK